VPSPDHHHRNSLEDGNLMMEEEQESPRVMPLRNDSGFEKALENIGQELERKKIS
jgi:hypothetical protein